MCTLVEADGSIATAVSQPSSRGVAVEQKASLMVEELKKYEINSLDRQCMRWEVTLSCTLDTLSQKRHRQPIVVRVWVL